MEDSIFISRQHSLSSSMLETLQGVESTLRQHFEIKDWQGVRIILAAAAHYTQGQMIIRSSRRNKHEWKSS